MIVYGQSSILSPPEAERTLIMYEEKKQVRNSCGKLICDLEYVDGVWNVTIKKKGCYTTMGLMADGAVSIEDCVFGAEKARRREPSGRRK